ncbi:MAG: GAF domain-containing protein [Nitrospirae bacterium]|nr:GAF domain-containing protein [Magnetococcales bacterium]HAT49412.1 diguanylate cyclase [Alphaproteobacteria bacterium]
MGFDLFENENAAIDAATALLDRRDAPAEDLAVGLENLLKDYRKLFKGSQRLMRMSDRSEEKIKQAHAQIQTQQQALSEAHAQLSGHAETLERTVLERTADLVKTKEKLEKLVSLGISLSAERSLDALLENILQGGKNLTHADAGTLYLRTKEDNLRFSIVRTDSLGIAMGGPGGSPVFLPAVMLKDPATGEPNHRNVASYSALSGETVVIEDAYNSDRFDFSGVRQFDQGTGYRSQSFLTVPLKPRQGKVIGVLQLINAMDIKTGKVIPFDPDVVKFVEALAAQASMTLDNQTLLQSQKELFNSFIRLIASAIDAKSPYTGGHCERVPELANMLAEAVCRIDHGPFAAFKMTPDEHSAMHLSAWLHDCGKVTTPEYVVDKATKLETIYNRIHEVRMRFEVLYRDAEIAYLRGVMDDWQKRDDLKAVFDARIKNLQEDYAFIAECNVGGEFMAPEKKERVKQMAQQTWTRHFDDRIGLSHAELKRKGTVATNANAMEERLLDDKLEHIIPRERDTIKRDAALGIQMPAPQHLYNMGEIYNLCIDRGTLNAEERYKINEHVVQTLAMLSQLPFPEGMELVPEYAGAHHETMIGSGYPRKLTHDEMSVPARIMAIADVFEALTATDRPYKEPKTLSQAVRIMSFMKKDKHIDPDLFHIFLESGVFRKYADRFLEPNQMDEVDVAQFLR